MFAIESWAKLLTTDSLNNWVSNYTLEAASQKKVAIIMAGNIPFVGFHDFLCALICNHEHHQLNNPLTINTSYLFMLILTKLAPELKGSVTFLEQS